jgi:predicted branched-subunit amino acid permease
MLGVAVGNFIPDMEKLGLNFALPAMFIALFFMTAENKKGLIVGALAGVLSVLFIVVGLKDANVILATVIAATAGVMVKNGF